MPPIIRNETQPIRILLASHQPIIRSALRTLLERESDFQVVAEAANGSEAIVLSDYKQSDIALLDIKLAIVSGIAVAKQISLRGSRPSTVFVSAHTDQSYVHEAFRVGARGYVNGDSAPTELPQAIRAVARGRVFLSPDICSQLLEPHVTKGNISEYEKTLWCFIAAGYDESETAKLMNIEAKQVRLDCHSLRSFFCRNSLPDAISQSIFSTQMALH